MLTPVVRVYQFLLYPVARPSAKILDWWLGHEGMIFWREHHLREVIQLHMDAHEAEVSTVEGRGALNFLDLDDLPVGDEGEPVLPASIITLPVGAELPLFPEFARTPDDPFLQQVQASGAKWTIIVDETERPRLVLNTDAFLRCALFGAGTCNPYAFCHRPLVAEDPSTQLGRLLQWLHVDAEHGEDDVIDLDVILLWSTERRIVTGSDLLGRLLRGITDRRNAANNSV